MINRLLRVVFTLMRLALTRARLAAENLFLRRQLALYHERGVKPRRPDSESSASARFRVIRSRNANTRGRYGGHTSSKAPVSPPLSRATSTCSSLEPSVS